jgi:hypothetical protein
MAYAQKMLIARCRHCDQRRELRYRLQDEGEPVGARALGGASASTLLDEIDFVGEIGRVAAAIALDPEPLVEPAWSQSFEAILRLLCCLEELTKFRREDLRGWIDAEKARWLAVLDRYEADAARVYPRDPLANNSAPPRGTLSREAMAQHEATRGWHYKPGPDGDACRFTVANHACPAIDLRATKLCHFSFEAVSLHEANLDNAAWEEGVLRNVRLDRAVFHGAAFAKSRLTNVSFDDASLRGARFGLDQFLRCSLAGAELAGTDLDLCTFERSSLRGAQFDDARMGIVSFLSCDLRDITMSAAAANRAAELTFERCDLRDADLRDLDHDNVVMLACALEGTRLPKGHGWRIRP